MDRFREQMNEDKKVVEKVIKDYITIIIEEYGEFISEQHQKYLINNEEFALFNEPGTISFIVKDKTLYLPSSAYPVLEKLSTVETCQNAKIISEEDYLNTNYTYEDYINNVISSKFSPLEYFLDSLLHEVMHICGSGGGFPLYEGINELKTRELAQKRHIHISAMAYPKEVEIALKLQKIIGKETMDHLTFLNKDFKKAYAFIKKEKNQEIADLYQKVDDMMIKENQNYQRALSTISNPYEKAQIYSKIEYKKALELIENFNKK